VGALAAEVLALGHRDVDALAGEGVRDVRSRPAAADDEDVDLLHACPSRRSRPGAALSIVRHYDDRAMYPAAEIRERLSGALDSRDEFPDGTPDRLAAVLVPLITDGETRVILTKRTATLSRHAGEVSFPGGLADPGEGPTATALRESEEELGMAAGAVEVL